MYLPGRGGKSLKPLQSLSESARASYLFFICSVPFLFAAFLFYLQRSFFVCSVSFFICSIPFFICSVPFSFAAFLFLFAAFLFCLQHFYFVCIVSFFVCSVSFICSVSLVGHRNFLTLDDNFNFEHFVCLWPRHFVYLIIFMVQ